MFLKLFSSNVIISLGQQYLKFIAKYLVVSESRNHTIVRRFGGRGHSKSTFVEEGWKVIKKQTKTNNREGVLVCVYVRFFKKNAEIFKMKFYSYSPVFAIDYNGSMKY